MDYNYLYSIINLYLKKENSQKKMNVILSKKKEKIVFYFSYTKDSNNQTTFDLPIDLINKYLVIIINRIKEKNMIIDEKYQLNNKRNQYRYSVQLSNGRRITFINFTTIEVNNIRNILYNIQNINSELKLMVEEEPEVVKMNYNPKLQETGFVNVRSLFLVAIILADIFMLSLWFFKIFIIG